MFLAWGLLIFTDLFSVKAVLYSVPRFSFHASSVFSCLVCSFFFICLWFNFLSCLVSLDCWHLCSHLFPIPSDGQSKASWNTELHLNSDTCWPTLLSPHLDIFLWNNDAGKPCTIPNKATYYTKPSVIDHHVLEKSPPKQGKKKSETVKHRNLWL